MSLLALADAGFADRGMIRPLVRRIALKGAVKDVRASIEALIDLINEEREPLAGDGAVLREQGVDLAAGDEEHGIEGAAISCAQRHALREDELLQGVNLFAQLLDRIEIGIRHGLFSCASEAEPSEAAGSTHRLCGGAE